MSIQHSIDLLSKISSLEKEIENIRDACDLSKNEDLSEQTIKIILRLLKK
ncbi:MAG: hypothetical protein HON90_14570 [Halobacteriovoraceae bacterium]|jgi:hypothetical protein|nr:hypothetical protein [Halobacteriovoraceae bacterium]